VVLFVEYSRHSLLITCVGNIGELVILYNVWLIESRRNRLILRRKAHVKIGKLLCPFSWQFLVSPNITI